MKSTTKRSSRRLVKIAGATTAVAALALGAAMVAPKTSASNSAGAVTPTADTTVLAGASLWTWCEYGVVGPASHNMDWNMHSCAETSGNYDRVRTSPSLGGSIERSVWHQGPDESEHTWKPIAWCDTRRGITFLEGTGQFEQDTVIWSADRSKGTGYADWPAYFPALPPGWQGFAVYVINSRGAELGAWCAVHDGWTSVLAGSSKVVVFDQATLNEQAA